MKSLSAFGQASVSTSGSWTFTRGSSNITNPGLDFDNVASSGVAGETTLNLSGLEKNKTWKVYISRVDNNWHSTLILTASKTNDGIVSATNGGVTIPLTTAAQISITNASTLFFIASPSNSCNSCNLINVKIRYELSGVSVTLPAATYQTQIQYTISDI